MQGPTTKSYASFLDLGFEDKMSQLMSGDFAVLCQGFRDIFLHASLFTDAFQARAVEASNYSPQIPNLISYSHSTVKIWIEELKRWVVFDPWLAIMVTMEGGPIGSQELQRYFGQGKIKKTFCS